MNDDWYSLAMFRSISEILARRTLTDAQLRRIVTAYRAARPVT